MLSPALFSSQPSAPPYPGREQSEANLHGLKPQKPRPVFAVALFALSGFDAIPPGEY